MSGHYTTLELVDYARGYLTGDEARDLFAHCQRCNECGGRLAAVLALRMADSRRRSRLRRRKVLSTAASVTCAALIGFGGAALWDEYRSPPSETAEAAPELAPDLAALAALATTELPHPSFLELRLGMMDVDTDDWEPRVRAAILHLWDGRLGAAIPALESLHEDRPTDPEVAAYLGIALYLSGDRRDDVADLLGFGATTDWNGLEDQALWYLANHRLRGGDPAGCADLLAGFSEHENVTARAAHSLLERLPARYRSPTR